MLQRVQSIYLLLASGSFFGTFLTPFASSEVAVPATVLADQEFSAVDSIGMIVLFALAGLAAVAAIFLYANRKLQIQISWAAMSAGLLAYGAGVLAFMQDGDAIGNVAVDGSVGALFPLLGAIMSVLAVRHIRKDEKLVRSADRLR